MQQEINSKVGKKSPGEYFHQLLAQVQNGDKIYGAMDNLDEPKLTLKSLCIPLEIFDMEISNCPDFLNLREAFIC